MAEIQFLAVELWDRTRPKWPKAQTPVSALFLRPQLLRHVCVDTNMVQTNKCPKNGYRALSVSAEMATFQLSTGNWSCCCGCLLSQFQDPRGHPGTLNDELGGALMPSLFAPGVVQSVLFQLFAIQPVT